MILIVFILIIILIILNIFYDLHFVHRFDRVYLNFVALMEILIVFIYEYVNF